MEEPKRPNCAPEKKQVVVNIGRVRGGGIGGVILLGGALAAAAFASAFIFGRKRRSGYHNNSHRNTHIPPPPAAGNKKDERGIEANGKGGSTFPDANKQSSETIKKMEFQNDNQSLVLDETHRTEINGVAAVCYSETSEQILCSITTKRPENGAISNGAVSHFPAGEEKTMLPLEMEKTAMHDAKIQSSGEAAIDGNGIAEDCKDFEEVEAEEESKDAREIELMGEIHEVKCEDTEDSNGNYVPEIGLKSREGTFVPQHGKDGQESSLPVVGSPISRHENVNDEEKQDYLSSKVVENIHDGEAIQPDEEDQLERIEEHLVQGHDKCNEPDKEIVPVKGEEDLVQDQLEHTDEKAIQQDEEDRLQHIEKHFVRERKKFNEPGEEIVLVKGEEEKEDQRREENIEEKGYVDNSTPENMKLGDSGKEDVQILAIHLPEDEPISSDEMQVSEDAVNGEIEMPFCQQKDTEDEVERNIENEVDSSETIDTGIATSKDEEDIIDGTDGDEDLSDEAGSSTERTVDTSMESDFGGVWPAKAIQEPSIETQQQKLVDQDIEGKIEEDTLKRGKYELHPNKIIADNTQITNGRCNSAKKFIERHVADLATLKDYSTNSGTLKVLLVAIPVLSSFSCSWFFGLSFDKFCFVVLLTIVLSKSMIVK